MTFSCEDSDLPLLDEGGISDEIRSGFAFVDSCGRLFFTFGMFHPSLNALTPSAAAPMLDMPAHPFIYLQVHGAFDRTSSSTEHIFTRTHD